MKTRVCLTAVLVILLGIMLVGAWIRGSSTGRSPRRKTGFAGGDGGYIRTLSIKMRTVISPVLMLT